MVQPKKKNKRSKPFSPEKDIPVGSRSVDKKPKLSEGVTEPNLASTSPINLQTFDFSTPKKVFESLIAPITFDDFFNNYWEKKPLILHRHNSLSPALLDYIKSLFSRKTLESILKQENIQFGRDVNACRYKDKQNESLNPDGRMTVAKFGKLYDKEKATFQFHQPQRFQNELWKLLENLESFFACLVGANVYLTPNEAQGLAPHYDDVEVFIIQLEGEKYWRLYKPPTELPRDYVTSLSQEEIGDVTHEFVLKPGDFLYFPRGTVHQAFTPPGSEHSTHITISTYQQHTWGDYMMSVFPNWIEEAMKSEVDFRRGLPINFLKSSKLSKTDKVQSVLNILLQKLATIGCQKFAVPSSMIEDFMASRLPPFGVDPIELQESQPDGIPPNLSCEIRLNYPDHVCFVIKTDSENEESDGDEEEDEEKTDKNSSKSPETAQEFLGLYSSLLNDRRSHMLKDSSNEEDEEDDGSNVKLALKLPTHYLEALELLKSKCDQFIPATDLPLPSDGEKEHLMRALWSCHLLQVISKDQKPRKSTKVD